ncbi:hypothetical protein E2C01_066256 [Portunus trituberculatus]|uniref:Uncharacterized protein n=1 Tax=Portunus trituberculatus TaxID=210409 RepID=A0A5B7HU67_PORTR|nr:hypothetical protein [Portunus trituberculatus]
MRPSGFTPLRGEGCGEIRTLATRFLVHLTLLPLTRPSGATQHSQLSFPSPPLTSPQHSPGSRCL